MNGHACSMALWADLPEPQQWVMQSCMPESFHHADTRIFQIFFIQSLIEYVIIKKRNQQYIFKA
jgi:hypothetical protein